MRLVSVLSLYRDKAKLQGTRPCTAELACIQTQQALPVEGLHARAWHHNPSPPTARPFSDCGPPRSAHIRSRNSLSAPFSRLLQPEHAFSDHLNPMSTPRMSAGGHRTSACSRAKLWHASSPYPHALVQHLEHGLHITYNVIFSCNCFAPRYCLCSELR